MIVHEKKAAEHKCCVSNCGRIEFRTTKIKAPHPQMPGAMVDTVANIQERFCEGPACMGWVWTRGRAEASDHMGYCGAKPVADSVPIG